MASISFGNISTVDGKTTLSGSQSGIDTKTLIESLTAAKRLPAVALEENITKNGDKITQLNTLNSKLTALQSALDKLRKPVGLSATTTDVFSARIPYLTSSDGSTASNYLGIVAKNGAAIKNYEVEITNLAVAESRKSVAFTTRTESVVNAAGDETSGKFSAGTFTLNGQPITLAENDTLNTIAAKINAKKAATNVEASILKINETDYRLIITSTKTGEDNAINIDDPDNVFVGGNEANIFATVTPAENAKIEIDGVEIERQSNTISDAIDNVTFSLFQETDELATAPKIKVDIAKDANAVSEAILGFIDAYNELRLFYGAQNERDDNNSFVDTAILHDSTLLDTISSSILTTLTSVIGVKNPFAVDDGSVTPKNLANLGITVSDYEGDANNGVAPATSILELDAATLTAKIESHFDAVQDLFGFSITSTSTNLALFKRDNITSTEAFTVVIDNTQAPGQQAMVTHIDGKALAAPAYLNYDTSDPKYTAVITGTGALAGLSLYYKGDGTSTESVSTTLNSGKKDYTIAVNPTADTANVTHIHGFQLAQPIAMDYKPSSTGGTITGPQGSVLSGMTFLHLGESTESIDISFSQGFADKVYNYISTATGTGGATTKSMIKSEIESLQSSNDSLQKTIDRIDTQIVSYREQLMTKFAALEAAIAASNSVLDLLSAQTNAQNNSN